MHSVAVAMVAAAVSEAREACKDEPDLMERLRKAMRCTHKLDADDGFRFRAALAAVMLESSETEKERIIQSRNAMLLWVEAVIDGVDAVRARLDGVEPLPLLQLWNESS